MAKKVIRLTQESCFQQQKRDCISMMINKARFFHPAGGKDETLVKESFAAGEQTKLKGHTEEDKKRRDLILRQIELDNTDDIKGDGLNKDVDRRVIKTNMKAHDIAPSKQLLN